MEVRHQPTKKTPKPVLIRMDSIEQPTETQLNPTVISILEYIVKPGSYIFHCSEHDMLFKDAHYKAPIIGVARLQEKLGLEKPSDVIQALESIGYLIHSDPCYNCQHERASMAQA